MEWLSTVVSRADTDAGIRERFYIYNTREDVDRFIKELKNIIDIF